MLKVWVIEWYNTSEEEWELSSVSKWRRKEAQAYIENLQRDYPKEQYRIRKYIPEAK